MKSEETIQRSRALRACSRASCAEGIATQRLSGLGRLVPSQLYLITVKGDDRGPTQEAARALADRVALRVGGHARGKIEGFRRQLRSLNTQLDAVDDQVSESQAQLGRPGLSGVERLVAVNTLLAEQRRGAIEETVPRRCNCCRWPRKSTPGRSTARSQ